MGFPSLHLFQSRAKGRGAVPQDKASPRPAVELYHSALRTHSVGICASDLKCYLGAYLFWGDAHRKGYCQVPVIPGHGRAHPFVFCQQLEELQAGKIKVVPTPAANQVCAHGTAHAESNSMGRVVIPRSRMLAG